MNASRLIVLASLLVLAIGLWHDVWFRDAHGEVGLWTITTCGDAGCTDTRAITWASDARTEVERVQAPGYEEQIWELQKVKAGGYDFLMIVAGGVLVLLVTALSPTRFERGRSKIFLWALGCSILLGWWLTFPDRFSMHLGLSLLLVPAGLVGAGLAAILRPRR